MTKSWNNHTLTITEDCYGWNYCNGIKGTDITRSIINWYIKTYKLNVDKVVMNSTNWSKLKTSLYYKFSAL